MRKTMIDSIGASTPVLISHLPGPKDEFPWNRKGHANPLRGNGESAA